MGRAGGKRARGGGRRQVSREEEEMENELELQFIYLSPLGPY